MRTRRNFVFQVALKYLNYEVQLEVRLSRFHKDVDNIEPLNFRHVVVIFHLFIYYNRQQVMLTKNLFYLLRTEAQMYLSVTINAK